MAIKEVITVEEFNELQEPMKVLYPHKNPDGTYGLDLEGRDDTSALKAGKDRLAKEKAELARDKALLEGKLKVLNEENKTIASKTENVVNANWDQRVKDLEDNYRKQNDALRKKAEKAEIDRVAGSLNGSWLSDEVGQIVLKNRVAIEYDGDDMKTVFLDSRGNKTLNDFESFKKSFVDEPSIKAILKASKASGGGASPNYAGGSKPALKDMTEEQRLLLAKEDPDAYFNMIKNKK